MFRLKNHNFHIIKQILRSTVSGLGINKKYINFIFEVHSTGKF
jgi:hypothetical protein